MNFSKVNFDMLIKSLNNTLVKEFNKTSRGYPASWLRQFYNYENITNFTLKVIHKVATDKSFLYGLLLLFSVYCLLNLFDNYNAMGDMVRKLENENYRLKITIKNHEQMAYKIIKENEELKSRIESTCRVDTKTPHIDPQISDDRDFILDLQSVSANMQIDVHDFYDFLMKFYPSFADMRKPDTTSTQGKRDSIIRFQKKWDGPTSSISCCYTEFGNGKMYAPNYISIPIFNYILYRLGYKIRQIVRISLLGNPERENILFDNEFCNIFVCVKRDKNIIYDFLSMKAFEDNPQKIFKVINEGQNKIVMTY